MRFFIYLSLLVLSACAVKNTTYSKEINEISHYATLEFEQNTTLLPQLSDTVHFDEKAYKKHFFSPWHSSFKNIKAKEFFWSFDIYKNPKNEYYFFNKQRIPLSWFEKQIANANVSQLGTINKKALVIQNSLLKNFPTQMAILKDPFKENEGIPFDYANDSIANIGSAVLISHYSKDKKYVFVQSESGFGFIESQNIEFFSEERVKIYENLHFLTPLKEKLPVFKEDGTFFFETRIGSLYPYYKEDKHYFYGKIGKNKFRIAKNSAAKFPLQFNSTNLKNQISQTLGLPYGWGGYSFERDCSLLLRELFSGFGLFLPRNSLPQKNAFAHFDISLLNNTQKQEFLSKFAKPYLSLLYLKGHIMLYVGQIQGQNSVFHSIWGLRKSKDERLLLSQSALTSLEIGKKEIKNEDLLLSKLAEVSIISLNDTEKMEIERYLENFKKSEF
ncbi:SH3 domain-containing protein [Campylobacter sp. MIT 21-1685]|uniref:SH3 domain-containing C40 family peptidase n=1 Tax=unclassified Campylobacter TaxID=2593542 RepID=UPI00224AABF4|nr:MULTISPECIES: SH3 domain-containing C40 family peptidase [unclassified Campylobacter]MCX2682810.1 SH3 domain-containing protein [Campylobacter sp. MIT 21-1684]MCX2751044.1 SH3 domain-containing protein [Campylobacter sp. MIT 21-1682]MCX2807291.1 SH3 domain-containing protein [Campylobacter sp. MIT 21-1685]